MKNLTVVLSLVLVCGCTSRVMEATANAGSGTMLAVDTVRDVVAIFTATLSASAACASVLEPEARKRSYKQRCDHTEESIGRGAS